mgnify:CR=1 FL=1
MIRRLLLLLLWVAGAWAPAQAARVKPAQLVVTSNPTGAEIRVDGAVRGLAPLTVENLAPGTYVVVARREGYRDERRAVSLLPDQRFALDLTLEELRGLVLVTGQPEGAEVFIDNAFRGKLPMFIPDFPHGTHRVRVAMPGYFTKEVDVTVRDRVPQQVEIALVPDAATLEITSEPAGATALINGAPRGETPLTVERVPSGKIALELRREGYQPFRQELVLRAGERQAIRAPLAALQAGLDVLSQPAGARVYIDDTYRGDTPLSLPEIPAGERRVRVELRGHETDARTVTLRAGEKSVEEFRLQLNSGVLVLTSEPPGAKVFIDGQEVGETKPAAAGMISEPLTIPALAKGEHTLQLTRAGYRHQPRRFLVAVGTATTLHERLAKLFVHDIEVRVDPGPSGLRTGMLRREHPNGDIEIETRPGVTEYISADRILSRRPITSAP